MLNQYVARERVADWTRLADNRRLVRSSRPSKQRNRPRWRIARPWRESPATVASQPVQA